MTLYNWLLLWLDKYEKNLIKRTTYNNYDSYIHNYFIQLDIPMEDITSSLLQDFFNERLDSGLAIKTVRNMAVIVKKAMKRAVIDKYIRENPALNIELPKIKKKEIKVLTIEQQDKLIAASYFNRYGTFFRLTLCTGLRLGELLGLKWIDVDFQKAQLHVRRILHRCKNYNDKIKTSTSIFLDEPKTEKSKRIIPLPKNAIEDLERWKYRQEDECGKTEFVVTDINGKYLDPSTFKKHYNQLLHKCDITGITFHALRHTFATRALEKGMDTKVLSEILGHFSVAFTLDTYAHVLDSFKRENMDLMNDIYTKSPLNQKIILSFKPFQGQFIVSIPKHQQYTFIANSIQDGIDYIRNKKSEIQLTQLIDVYKCVSSKAKDEILVCID